VKSAQSADTNSWTYSYLPGSHLLASVSNNLGMVASRTYEPHRDLITAVSNAFGGTLISAFDYTNDALGRRTARMDAQPTHDPVQNVFGYNARSEVNSALMGTNTYGYAYDPIGNRLVATNNAVATAYLANALNQYTNILSSAAPPREDIPTHDADGNLLANGEWSFAWDGESRLLAASNATTLVTYVHDFQSRRVGRKQYTWDADHWSPVTNQRFLYDGWALIREVSESNTGSATNHFVYGLDLSGSLQGAGTIGGILSASLNGTTVFYAVDANGNVTELVGTNGVIAEHYEYSPFGETIAHTRHPTFTQSQPFRFSTKRQDESTGLLYYGYRDLDTVWGRWVSRDPIRAKPPHRRPHASGLPSVELEFAFVNNSPIDHIDALGLMTFSGCKPEHERILRGKMNAVCETVQEQREKLGCCLDRKKVRNAGMLAKCLAKGCNDRENLHFICDYSVDGEGTCKMEPDGTHACAWVWPWDRRTITICPWFWDPTSSCNGLLAQGCVLLHELGHLKCNTYDTRNGSAYKVEACCNEQFWR